MNKRFFYDPLVKDLIESFSKAFSVKITFYSPSLEEWLVGFSALSSDYCTTIQKTLQLRSKCFEQDRKMCVECEKQKKNISYTCYGGLRETVIPIIIDSKLMFYAMVGQYRASDCPSADIISKWESLGLRKEELETSFFKQPYYSAKKEEAMLSLFKKTLKLLLEKELVKMRHPSLLDQVMEYLELNMDKPVTLAQVADYIGKSHSSISHAVKKELGFSFKELVIFKKIVSFERLVAQDSQLTIKQAASKVGYYDSLYFSRIYKKYRLIPPSRYLNENLIEKKEF